jgi:hypothetical protein
MPLTRVFFVGLTLLVAGCDKTNWQPPIEAAFEVCKAQGRVAEGLSLEPVGYGYVIRGGPGLAGPLEHLQVAVAGRLARLTGA